MKITGSQFQQIAKMYQKKNAQFKDSTESIRNSDKVNLSQVGHELKRIHDILSQTPNIRTDKVNQLKMAIQAGTYEVKGEKIAEKMIEGHLIDKIIG